MTGTVCHHRTLHGAQKIPAVPPGLTFPGLGVYPSCRSTGCVTIDKPLPSLGLSFSTCSMVLGLGLEEMEERGEMRNCPILAERLQQ